MNQIQSIMSLMKHDLNASQLAKLQSVLEAVLSVQKDLPPIDDLIRRFETSKRLMGHTNIATTLRYIDIDPCGVKQAFARPRR